MKKLLSILAFLPLCLQAQELIGGNNIIKANLSSLLLRNYYVTYERHIAPHLSLSLGVRMMPNGNLPFQSQIENMVTDPSITISRCSVSNFAITPELRFYLRGGMRGFYIAPYGRYSSFNLFVPVHYKTYPTGNPNDVVTKDADFSGKVTAFSGGVMIGVQHQLFKKIVLDIWIVGGHYGKSTGNLLATYTQSADPLVRPYEKQTLQSAIDNINASPFKVSGTVSPDTPTATITTDGPWVGLRALGINLGFRF